MVDSIEKLLEDKVFYYFSEISKIPRASGNEKGISDYLKAFAQDKNLYVRQDTFNNIVIKKAATIGYENAPAVIIQGHLDMVCEKNEGTIHDFETDAIELVVDGDQLKAKGTTLGADNGIAIAYALALLDSNDIQHPALEVVMTTDEEIGLTGALSMDVFDLEAKYFINLDSEEEGDIVVSCAGGLRAFFQLPLQYRTLINEGYKKVEISIKGLKGGHSGMEIEKNRANANVLTGRVLCKLNNELAIELQALSGGMKDNVIPREANATLYVLEKDMNQFQNALSEIVQIIKNEFKISDPSITITADFVDVNENTTVLVDKIREDIIFLLMTMPNGVQSMSAEIPNLVESSLNLGKLYVTDDKLTFEYATRSSVRSKKYHMTQQLMQFAKVVGATCVETKKYPEWPIKKDSTLLKICESCYENRYKVKPNVKGIHAGLESGVFIEKLPHLDAVSFGPNTYDVHSPDEWISIESVKRIWDYLLDVLKSIQ